MKWLRYSGLSITLTVNPYHWSWRPRAGLQQDEWAGPRERTYFASWLMISTRIWLDDGSW
jgi:hypothetical protein